MVTRLYYAEVGVIKRNSCYSSDANVRISLTVPLWLALSHGIDQPKSEQFTDICSFAQSQWSFRSDARERSKQTNTAFYRSVKDRQLTKNVAQKKITQI